MIALATLVFLGVYFPVFADSPTINSLELVYSDKTNQEHTFVVHGENLSKEENGTKVPNFKFYLTYSDLDKTPGGCDASKAHGLRTVGDVTPAGVGFKVMISLERRRWRICFFDLNNKLIYSELHVGNMSDKCIDSLKKDGKVKFLRKQKQIHADNILSIDTRECKGNTLSVVFHGRKVGFNLLSFITLGLDDLITIIVSNFQDVAIKLINSYEGETVKSIEFIPNEDTTKVYLVTNEDSCYSNMSGPDCYISTKITIDGVEGFNSVESLARIAKNMAATKSTKVREEWRLKAFDKATILAECDGNACSGENWELVTIEGARHNYANLINKEPVDVMTPKYDTTSKCYRSDLNDGEGGYDPNCYEFLAPIDFEDVNNGNLKGVKSEDGHTWIENIRDFHFGDYVNFLFRIAISALVIISVVMVMVAGVEYMTVESLFGKNQAKQRIKNALGGLILALSSYTILHTLNPKLLDIGALDNMETVSIEEQGDDSAVPQSSSNKTANHPKYNYSGDWPPANENFKTIRKGDKTSLETIISGVYVKNRECNHVADRGCTSLYFDQNSYAKVVNGLKKLKQDSGANKIIITGGSEYWLHKTHGPKAAILDIRSSNDGGNDGKALSRFLAGTDAYPGQCYDRRGIANYIDVALDENGDNGEYLCDPKHKRYPPPQVVVNARKGGVKKKTGTSVTKRSCCWNKTPHWHITFK